MTRIKLAAAKDLPKSGEKKDFVAFGEGDGALKILLSNVNGKIYATSAKWLVLTGARELTPYAPARTTCCPIWAPIDDIL